MIELALNPNEYLQKEFDKKMSSTLFSVDILPLLWFENDFEVSKINQVYEKKAEEMIYSLSSGIIRKMYHFYMPHKDNLLSYRRHLKHKEDINISFRQFFYDMVDIDFHIITLPLSWYEYRKILGIKTRSKKVSLVSILDDRFFESLKLYQQYDFDSNKIIDTLSEKSDEISLMALSMLISIREILFQMFKTYLLQDRIDLNKLEEENINYDFDTVVKEEYFDIHLSSQKEFLRDRKAFAIGSVYKYLKKQNKRLVNV